MSNDEARSPELPDPNGPPQPVRKKFNVIGCVVPVLAGGGVFTLAAFSMMPCVGATRSAKLEWERRRELIDLAQQEESRQESFETESLRADDE